jgi:hypothetical protein
MTTFEAAAKAELRLCEVNGEKGYFHCWGQYRFGYEEPSAVAVIEFKDGVRYVRPTEIKFLDDIHAALEAEVNE